MSRPGLASRGIRLGSAGLRIGSCRAGSARPGAAPALISGCPGCATVTQTGPRSGCISEIEAALA